MHEASIHSNENGLTRILVDGVDISQRCSRIVLEQNGGEFPVLTLTLVCNVDVNVEQAYVNYVKPPGA